jgi:hypothetical protein
VASVPCFKDGDISFYAWDIVVSFSISQPGTVEDLKK